MPTVDGHGATSDRLGCSSCVAAITHGELTLVVDARQIVDVLTFLRDDARCRFEVLIDICGVDWPAREQRFDVVYHLLSPRLNQRIRVKLETDETDTRAERDRRLSRRQLVRARSLRHVRHPVLGPSRTCAAC